jgi:hypothetical protein
MSATEDWTLNLLKNVSPRASLGECQPLRIGLKPLGECQSQRMGLHLLENVSHLGLDS